VVTDTGCGMGELTKGRLFEPFFTTKEKGKGTGLGLSTVYGIVKQSGGDIWVSSEPGQGTTLTILIPRELAITAATPESSAPQRRVAGTETVLVVEDEEALREVVRRTIDRAGYKVLTASGGDEAFETSAAHPGEIHLLVTDIVMPQMSGRVLAERLVEIRPKLRVLFMSGYIDSAIDHHGVLDAGTRFLDKPFTSADLMRKVREVLDATQSALPWCPTGLGKTRR
jgi:two-component system cell cycle sensor histidine kinase/response regulator CckA